jgi:hypothetical protein
MITYRNTELIKDLTEAGNLVLHICSALIPEALLLGLLKGNGSGFLERGHTAVTDASVGSSNILDQMLGSDQVSDTPASGVEGLAGRAHSQSALVQLRGEGSNSSEWDVEQTVVDFIREDDKVVLDAEVTNALELFAREDFPNGVMAVEMLAIVSSRRSRLLTESSRQSSWSWG